MKKTMRLFIYGLIILATLLAASGCTPAAKAPVEEETAPQKLTIWINARDSFIGPSEQKLSQDQWYISQAIKRFEAANPGVTVELVPQADALQAHQTFRTAGLAGNAPDIANLWAGQFIFALRDVEADISAYIPAEDKANLSGWDTVTLDFQEGNPVIGYPTPDNQMCFFLYNKKIIKEVGLDYENNPPRTIEAFMADMQKIKDAGYIPMAADEGAGYPYYFFYIAGYWWVQQNGLDPILAADRGEANFANDQALINTLKLYNEIWAKGYMNEDAATSGDSWNKFLQGQVALFPSVPTFIKDAQDALGEENVGAILPPNFSETSVIKDSLIGGPGQSLVVSKNSKNPELAVKFLSFINSKDEVLKFYQTQTKVPVRKDLTTQDLNLAPGSIGDKLFTWSGNYIFWVDNSLSGPVVDSFTKLLPLVLTGKMTPEDFAAELDKVKGQ